MLAQELCKNIEGDVGEAVLSVHDLLADYAVPPLYCCPRCWQLYFLRLVQQAKEPDSAHENHFTSSNGVLVSSSQFGMGAELCGCAELVDIGGRASFSADRFLALSRIGDALLISSPAGSPRRQCNEGCR